MSFREITSNASSVRDAIDELEGYPRDPTHRGSACPPPPFGRTVTHARLRVDPDTDSQSYVIARAVLNKHHGRMAHGVTIDREMGVPLPDAVPVDVRPGRGARR